MSPNSLLPTTSSSTRSWLKTGVGVTSTLAAWLSSAKSILAQGGPTPGGIYNPALNPNLGFTPDRAASGEAFVSYFRIIWTAVQTVGALLVLFYFLWGSLEWIASHGEKSKVESARNKMTQATIGFIVLISIFIITGYLGKLIGFDVLRPTFLTPDSPMTGPLPTP